MHNTYIRLKDGLRTTEIVRAYCTSASLSSVRKRTLLCAVCMWIYALRPARTRAFFFILVRFSADRRWCIVSIGICSLFLSFSPRTTLSLRRLLPSCPPPRFPSLALSLFRSFALAVLTNAGYNSIVGHDPQAVLTPRMNVSLLLAWQIKWDRIICIVISLSLSLLLLYFFSFFLSLSLTQVNLIDYSQLSTTFGKHV